MEQSIEQRLRQEQKRRASWTGDSSAHWSDVVALLAEVDRLREQVRRAGVLLQPLAEQAKFGLDVHRPPRLEQVTLTPRLTRGDCERVIQWCAEASP